MSWLLPRSALTPEQLRAVMLSAEEDRVVAGPPGSGKTQVLLHRADWLRERYGVRPERLRVLVFTRALTAYVGSGFADLGIPVGSVSTFDRWCCDLYRAHVARRLPEKRAGTPDFEAVHRDVADWFRYQANGPVLDVALVDEAQDLAPVCFEILARAAAHVTVFADFNQQIYPDRSDEEAMLRALGVRRRNLTILEAYRCCPSVALLAAQFLPEDERAPFLKQVRVSQGERDRPLLFLARTPAEEEERLADVLRTRLLRGERVLVLLAGKSLVAGLARVLERRGVSVEAGKDIDFASRAPKLMPYHSAKGLTADSVLLPCLTAEAFHRFTGPLLERLLFVGASRARSWVYLSSAAPAARPFAPLARLLGFGAAEVCTVQRAADLPWQPVVGPAIEHDTDDEADLTRLL